MLTVSTSNNLTAGTLMSHTRTNHSKLLFKFQRDIFNTASCNLLDRPNIPTNAGRSGTGDY